MGAGEVSGDGHEDGVKDSNNEAAEVHASVRPLLLLVLLLNRLRLFECLVQLILGAMEQIQKEHNCDVEGVGSVTTWQPEGRCALPYLDFLIYHKWSGLNPYIFEEAIYEFSEAISGGVVKQFWAPPVKKGDRAQERVLIAARKLD